MRDHQAFVGDCISSVAREFGPEVDLVCVDVGSLDGSIDAAHIRAEEVGIRLRVEVINRDSTSIDALAAAEKHIGTDFVALISGDDAFGTDYGRAVADVLAGCNLSVVVCFTLELTDVDLVPTGKRRSPTWTGNGTHDKKQLFARNPGTAPGMLLPWSVLVDQPGWRSRPHMLVEDYWLWWILSDSARFLCSNLGTVMYRRHPGGLSNQRMDHFYAYSIGYCVGIARANAQTFRQHAATWFLAARWARRVPASRYSNFARGLRVAKQEWKSSSG